MPPHWPRKRHPDAQRSGGAVDPPAQNPRREAWPWDANSAKPFLIGGTRELTVSLPPLAWWVLTSLLIIGSGCSKNTSGHWFEKPRTSKEWLDIALEAAAPDERRRGVVGLSRSADGRTDWAMRVYDTVARTDKDAMVRTAAVGAMWPGANAEQVPTLLKIMQADTQHFDDVKPAAAPLRWAAAKVLLAVVNASRYQEAQRPQIVKVLLDRLSKDPDRNVKLTMIETLSYFAEQPIPLALADVMQENDFAIQSAAERSLIALTGVTHHHDAAAWKKWLASTTDPFEKAGQIPEGAAMGDKPRKWKWEWGW